jgi:hypothetical protein
MERNGIDLLERVLLENGRRRDEAGNWHGPDEAPPKDPGKNGNGYQREPPASDRARIIERARRYVAKMPASVSGNHGHDAAWEVAVVLVRGFALTAEEALPLLREFSAHCSPPWSEKELLHKLADAEHKSRLPRGYLLNKPPPNGDRHAAAGQAPADSQSPAPYRVRLMDSPTFEAGDYRHQWLVEHVLVRGQPCVLGGPKKSLKSSVLVDLALSLASGAPFLGEFRVPRKARVAVLSGESGEASLQAVARRVAAGRGIGWPQVEVFWGFDLPQLSVPDHLAALREVLERERVEVLVYDPLYLGLLAGSGADGISAANLYQVGPLLLGAAKACLAAGATPILAHHFKITRGDAYAEPQLEDLAYAGVQEFARQWILLGRREPFDPDDPDGRHQLWLQAGGSAGHGLLRAVDVCEGKLLADFSGRTWRVEVTRPAEARVAEEQQKTAEKERNRAAQDKADGTKVLAALDALDPGREGVTLTRLRDEASLSGERTRKACRRLAKEGVVEEVSLKAIGGNGAKIGAAGFRRRPQGSAGREHPEH